MAADTSDDKRVFDTSLAAFAHACAEHETEIVPEQPLLAMVLDAKEEFGADVPVDVQDDGNVRLTLRVASEDGGFIALSRTTKPPKQPLAPGDLVCWVPLKHDADLAKEANDDRFGWIGLVFATLEPEWDQDEWALREFYE